MLCYGRETKTAEEAKKSLWEKIQKDFPNKILREQFDKIKETTQVFQSYPNWD
jgi:hypothetical protein